MLCQKTQKKNGLFLDSALNELLIAVIIVAVIGSLLGDEIEQLFDNFTGEDWLKIAKNLSDQAQDAGENIPEIEVDPGAGSGEALIEYLEKLADSFSDFGVLINIIVYNFTDFLSDLANLEIGEAAVEHPIFTILFAIVLIMLLNSIRKRKGVADVGDKQGIDFREY